MGKMTFEQYVKKIPHFKVKPEDYTRDKWYFFPEDKDIYLQDVTKLAKKYPNWKNIVKQAKFNVEAGKVISDKEGLSRWVDEVQKHLK